MSEAKVFLHPLVIMNIADHQARAVAEGEKNDPKNPPRVLGAVFGTQKDQAVEIFSSVEMPYKYDEEKQIRIDHDTFAEDTDLYKQIYPEHECLGWYSTSAKLEAQDLTFHKRFTEYNESPLYLRMNPVPRRDDKEIPVTVYQMQLKVIKDVPQHILVELPKKVIADPSERVATDHVLRNKDIPSTGSQIVPSFDELKGAVHSLQQRIQLLLEYLDRVEKKKIEENQVILKDIQGICNRIPTMCSTGFKEEFFTEMSNGMMMTYLAAMTKAAAQVNDTMDLFDKLNEGGGRRGRGGHMFKRFLH